MKQMKILEKFKLSGLASLLFPILSILLGLFGAGIVIAFMGVNPILAYKEMISGSLGSFYGISTTLLRFTPLAFAGLAVTLAFRAGVFNIGVEGQLYMGALFATWVGTSFSFLPAIIHIPLALVVGGLAGGFWGFIPGYCKAKYNLNVILVSIFLNFVAINLLGAAVSSVLKAPGQGISWSAKILDSAELPYFPGTVLHIGILLIFVLALLLHYILKNTTIGYQIDAVGLNQEASQYGGINSKKVIILAMFFSGFIASFAGSVEILGIQHRLTESFLVDYGYNAIPVALLGGLHPIGTLIAAFLYGAIIAGSSSMQITMGVPVSIVKIIMALAILGSIGMNGVRKILSDR
jgi:simple sugar transport system permease protein